MAESVGLLKRVEKYVLIFDICSSTKIVECLTEKEHQESWRDLIIEIAKFLIKERETLDFEIYKFLGDGWI